MKKIIAVIVFVLVAAGVVSAQADGMLNLSEYSNLFLNVRGRMDSKYLEVATDDDYDKFVALGGAERSVDTPLEIALLSICAGVAEIRPAEANRMIGTPRQADLKLGAAVFQEMQILRFLGDTAAVSRHEAVLSFITGRGNATRAEIETYYRNGIRGLIAGIVDEEFNEIRFSFENSARTMGYNAVLTRNLQTGQYVLSYERPSIQNSRAELSDTSLVALLAKMRANTNDFDRACVNTVRAQAALIPAVALSDAALAEITNIITRFYTEPNQSTYTAVVEAYSIIRQVLLNTQNNKYTHATNSYVNTLAVLNIDLANRAAVDVRSVRSITTLTRAQQQRLVGLR